MCRGKIFYCRKIILRLSDFPLVINIKKLLVCLWASHKWAVRREHVWVNIIQFYYTNLLSQYLIITKTKKDQQVTPAFQSKSKSKYSHSYLNRN